jgi:molybdenum cofactor cytidylyltransferase
MPFISMEIIQQIINTLKKGALITVPVCDGRRGHPVGFTRMLYPELIQLQGDSGGKSLLNRYKSNVVEIECQDPGIYCDIDTPQDFEKYSKKFCYSEEQNIKPLAPE